MENNQLTAKCEVYKQNGLNYRFFLGWRHAAFGGHLVVLGAIVTLSFQAFRDAKPIVWLIPLSGAILSAIFWGIDYRIRRVFQAAIIVGRRLEEDLGASGFFSEQKNIGTIPRHDQTYPKFLSHSSLINVFYLGSAVVLLIVGALLVWRA